MPSSLVWMTLFCLAPAGESPAPATAAPKVGSRVVTRYARPLRVEDRVVDDGSTTRVYTVEQAQGGFVWLVAGNVAGWVEARHVIPADQAIPFYTREIETRGTGEAYNWRGVFLARRGDLESAIADYDAAIRLDLKSGQAFEQKAWLLATCSNPAVRDGTKAIKAATRACELTRWADLSPVDALAAAHAEAGDFAHAVEQAHRAIDHTPADSEARKDRRDRLALYERRQPDRTADCDHP